jgi:CDP-diacylglycerol---glycerol-3-phosphate 3-phosphatidyltransferase
MSRSKQYLPTILLYSRELMALAIGALVAWPVSHGAYIVLILLYCGLLSDIFDGVLARKWQLVTAHLRIADTVIDLAFFASIVAFIWTHNAAYMNERLYCMMPIFILEIGMYAISLIRFGQLPSPHSKLSKLWGIYLVITFTLLLIGVHGDHFNVALMLGCLVHLDRMLIYAFLPQWDHDVASCFHAWKTKTRIYS